MLWITIISRFDIRTQKFQIELKPLWGIDYYRDGMIEILYEKLNSVILFMPLGFLLGLKILLSSNKYQSRLCYCLKQIGFAILIS